MSLKIMLKDLHDVHGISSEDPTPEDEAVHQARLDELNKRYETSMRQAELDKNIPTQNDLNECYCDFEVTCCNCLRKKYGKSPNDKEFGPG